MFSSLRPFGWLIFVGCVSKRADVRHFFLSICHRAMSSLKLIPERSRNTDIKVHAATAALASILRSYVFEIEKSGPK